MNNITKALMVGAICGLVMAEKTFAGDKYDPKGGHHQPGVKIDFDPSIRANAKAISDANASSFSKGGSAVISGAIQGGTGTGGTIQSGAVRSNLNGGNTTVSGVGNTNYSVPRQTPIAYAPGLSTSFSQQNCTSSASIGVSAPFGAIGGGVPISDDNCDRRADSIRWQEMNAIPVACNRMLIDSEENQEALKAAGMNCNELKSIAIAAPVAVLPPQETPALDAYDRKKRDELFNDKMMK